MTNEPRLTGGEGVFILEVMGKRRGEFPHSFQGASSNTGFLYFLIAAGFCSLTMMGFSFADEVSKKKIYTRSEDKKKAEELAMAEKPVLPEKSIGPQDPYFLRGVS
jgi:hypothetical protein